jgi:hypothetical protein
MKQVVAVILMVPMVVQAGIFKCTVDGVAVYQSSPCSAGDSAEVTIRPEFSRHATTGSGLGDMPPAPAEQLSQPDVTKRANDYITLREISKREYKIKYTHQREIRKLQGKMKRETAALKRKKRYARNNLAGATWEQSLSTEMQAVATKYNSLVENEREEIKRLRQEISDLRSGKMPLY